MSMAYGAVTTLSAPLIVMLNPTPLFLFILKPEVHPSLPAVYADKDDAAVDVGWSMPDSQHADLVLNVRYPTEFVLRVRCSLDDAGDRMTLGLLRDLPADPMVIFYSSKDEAQEALAALREEVEREFTRFGVGVDLLDCDPLRALRL